jgi:hypothetical protein
VAQHERQVEPDVVGHDRGLADPGHECGQDLGRSRRLGHIRIGQSVDLVTDDRVARVHERLEPIHDLAIAHLQGGNVDDVAVLRLHGGGLDVEDHELGALVAQRLAELDDGVRLGPEERGPLGGPGAGDQLLLELDRLLELSVAPGDGVQHDAGSSLRPRPS